MKLNKWELQANEKLLGEAAASYITKQMIVMPKPKLGKLHIIDQRVVFTDALPIFFDSPLDQVFLFLREWAALPWQQQMGGVISSQECLPKSLPAH